MDVLVADIQTVILTQYAPVHGPLWAMASRHWAQTFADYCARAQLETDRYAMVWLGLLARAGCVELLRWIKKMRGPHRTRWPKNRIMCAAARGGCEQLVRVCRDEWGERDADGPMAAAAKGGHLALVRLCNIEWLASHIEWTARCAAKKGHDHIVRFCCENHWCRTEHCSCAQGAMSMAALGGHEQLVRWCYTHGGAHGVRAAMVYAANGGHERIMRICHDEWKATNVDQAMASAAAGGHVHIMRICHDEWGERNVNKAMGAAAASGHIDIVRLCHDTWGATDVFGAMLYAAENGHIDIVRLCYDWWNVTERDDCTFHELKKSAHIGANVEIIKLYRTWRAAFNSDKHASSLKKKEAP